MASMASVRQELLIVCLVDSSVNVLHEWNDILLAYITPLLQRIVSSAKSSRNEFRIGFISYSDSHVHPNPILARRFFAPVSQFAKELKDDPSSLGLGRTASGSRRGMAILEGYVAVLEMFDNVGETRPPSQVLRSHPQNEPLPDPTCYLIHVASSPPNKAMRPSWNTNPALDEITWASLPSELLKRKIRSNMILTRPIPELQEFYKQTSRSPDPPFISLIKPCHKLLFSGLPPRDTKTVPQKRPATETPENSHQSAPSHPSSGEGIAANPTKTTSISPVTTAPVSSSPPRPGSVTSGKPTLDPQSSLQAQAQSRLPAPGPPNIDPVKLAVYIHALDNECRLKLTAINQARAIGRPQAEIDAMQADIAQKMTNRGKIVTIYREMLHRQQTNRSAPALSQSVNLGQNQQVRPIQDQSDARMVSPVLGSSAQGVQLGPPPAGNVPFLNPGGPNLPNKNIFQSMPISARTSMEVQMQKMLAERTRPPVLAAAPQTQPPATLPPPNPSQSAHGIPPSNMNQSQAQSQSTTATVTGPATTDDTAPRASLGNYMRRWQGVLAWPTGPASVSTGTRKENQLYIALYSTDNNLRCELWPQKLMLQPSRCVPNTQQIQGWVKELNPAMGLVSSTPIPGNPAVTAQNAKLFRQLKELIQQKNMLAYCRFDIVGGLSGIGFVTLPMNSAPQGDLLVALIFHTSSIPAALIVQAPPKQAAPDSGKPPEISSVPQTTNVGGLIPPSNLSAETKAFLQHQQAAAALAVYNQQQPAQQQSQQTGLASNSGSSIKGLFNATQFMQGVASQPVAENRNTVGGLNHSQGSAYQQVQHRQPAGINPVQIGGLQALQFSINRRPEEGQGQ